MVAGTRLLLGKMKTDRYSRGKTNRTYGKADDEAQETGSRHPSTTEQGR